MKFEVLLQNEIENLLGRMAEIDPSTDEYKDCNKALDELIDRLVQWKKLEMDQQVSFSQMKHETEIKEMELQAEAKTNKINGIINAAGIIVPAAVSVWGTCKTFKFEGMDGILTSTAGKQIINKLFKK